MALGDIQSISSYLAIRKRLNLYLDVTNPLAATHLLAESLCWAPEGAHVKMDIYGDGSAQVVYHPLPEVLTKFIGSKPWPASYLRSIPAPNYRIRNYSFMGWPLLIACCAWLDFRIQDREAEWGQHFENGEPMTEFEILDQGETPAVFIDFELNRTVIPDTRFNRTWLLNWGRDTGFNFELE